MMRIEVIRWGSSDGLNRPATLRAFNIPDGANVYYRTDSERQFNIGGMFEIDDMDLRYLVRFRTWRSQGLGECRSGKWFQCLWDDLEPYIYRVDEGEGDEANEHEHRCH